MNVLVTGGAGYIGRFCVRRLIDAGHAVVSFDRQRHPPGFPRDALTVQGDLSDQDLLERILREQAIDAVVHLAAEKSVSDAMAAPGPHLQNNVGGSLSLLEAMRRANVRRMVFSSSAAVYGTPGQLPVNEAAALRPDNPYGAGKAMVEDILRWYHACHGFESIALRYFNAAGAAEDGSIGEDWTDAQNLVPVVMKALLGASGPLHVFGTDFPTPDGTAIRDYVHVEDVAEVHVRALDYLTTHPGTAVMNVGTGRGASVRQVLESAERVSGRHVPFVDAPRRAGDPAAIWADTTRAADVLGWRSSHSLDDIVRSAWIWHSTAAGSSGAR
jgi:UDP-glucose 4-epimerase